MPKALDLPSEVLPHGPKYIKSETENLEKHYGKWRRKLSPKQRASIETYTGNSFDDINKGLWKNPIIEKDSIAADVQGALLNAPPPPSKGYRVWRGLDKGGLEKAGISRKAGQEFQLNGFQSSTINPKAAHRWARDPGSVLEIIPKQGAYIDKLSFNGGELEFLIPHGRKYRVKGRAMRRIEVYKDEYIDREVLVIEQID